MKNTVRWVIAVLLLMALALGLSCPSIVEAEGVQLPLDFTKGGVKTDKEKWTYDGKTPMAYSDSTIEVTSEKSSVTEKVKGKSVKHEVWVIRIKIQDVSQLRTAVSKDTYNGRGQAKGEDIAKSKNAVVAMNGDFFKYENDVGYVVRQGEFIRDATDTKRKKKGEPICFDMLLVDSEGDFHIIPDARTKEIEAFIETERRSWIRLTSGRRWSSTEYPRISRPPGRHSRETISGTIRSSGSRWYRPDIWNTRSWRFSARRTPLRV